MKPMYKSKAFSPITMLVGNISATATVIEVNDISAFPAAPNYATMGVDETAETILYTAISGNSLSGITRGVEGTARSWVKDTLIARNFTAADYEAMRENIENSVQKNTNNAGQIQFTDGENLQDKYVRERWSGSEPGAVEYDSGVLRFLHPAEFLYLVGDSCYATVFNGAARFEIDAMVFPDHVFIRNEGLPYNVLVMP